MLVLLIISAFLPYILLTYGIRAEHLVLYLFLPVCLLNVVNKPSPEDDPTRRQPNIYLAEKALKWEATIELKEGLDLTIDYFNNL